MSKYCIVTVNMRLLNIVAVISLTIYVDTAGNDIYLDAKTPTGGTEVRANSNNDPIRTQLFGPNGQEYGTQGFGSKRYRLKGYGSPGSQFQRYNSQALRPQALQSNGPKRQSWKTLVKQQRPYASYLDSDYNFPHVVDEKHTEHEFQKSWEPPQYHKALEDFDAVTKNVWSHLREPHTYRNDNNFRFTVIAVVVDGLAKDVAERGWQYYDAYYTALVKSLAEKAVVNPTGSVDVIRCIYRHANESIQKLRILINQKRNEFSCSQPNTCDTVIFGILKSNPHTHGRYEKQVDLLLKLGDVASTYLNTYSDVFEAASEQNYYQYLMTGKEVIRDLVDKTARVRNTLYPNGGPTREQCASSFTEFDIGY